ncbi:hypothetical protein H4R20_002954 [Coemansia guatemalensis]|uniref:ARM repeat-containing protein n=1 Tax=Coemansia guatemalensis TaxID=2761395 RepID=A0A9W8HWX8_9FUNG|nr:hypothetical protein H4R20_002954 [Coemansia guatemalensis]
MAIPTRARRAAPASANEYGNNSSSAGTATTPSAQWLAKAETWDSTAQAVSQENLGPVLEYLLTSQDQALSLGEIVTTAKVFKVLADMSRTSDIRQVLTEATELGSVSCHLLQRTVASLSSGPSQQHVADERAEHVFLLVQLLRCICNQSADNDAGRAKILQHGGISTLAAVLRSVDEVWREPLLVGQAAFGAALNVSLDNAECTAALISAGAMGPHIRALSPDAAGSGDELFQIWSIICMSLDNMCEHEQAVPELEGHADLAPSMLGSLVRITQMLSNGETTNEDTAKALRGAQRTLLWILCETLEKSAGIRKQLCQPQAMLSLFDVLEFYLCNGAESEGQADDEQGAEPGTATEAAPQPLPPNKPMPQTTNRSADAITQMIVGVSGEDEGLEVLFENQRLMDRLLSAFTSGPGAAPDPQDQRHDAMAAAAALCLGNLARTDNHCSRLVAEHPALVRTLIHDWFASRGPNVRTRHAASGLLKNLCLASANKQRMADFGLIAVAADNIDTAVVPIMANAIGILRHLLNGPAAVEVVSELLLLRQPRQQSSSKRAEECALETLLRAVRETDIDGIRCEGTRLVAAVVKKVYLRKDERQPQLERAQQDLEARGAELVEPLVRLVMLDGQRHPLLQQESLVALTVLVSASSSRASYAHSIVRLLAPENSVPLANPMAQDAEEEADDDKDKGEDSDKKTAAEVEGFAGILRGLLNPEGAVWPQTTLQAKSMVTQLKASMQAAGLQSFDPVGLAKLQTDILPLAD